MCGVCTPIANKLVIWVNTLHFLSGVSYTYKVMYHFYSSNSFSDFGVQTEVLDNGDIKCTARHLTSFTVLVSVTGEEGNESLQIVSYVGCSISIIALIITIIFMLALRSVTYDNEISFILTP